MRPALHARARAIRKLLPVRGLAANGYGPQAQQGVATNGAATVDYYFRQLYVVGADSVDMQIEFPNWTFAAGTGFKYPGNSIQVMEAAVEIGASYRQLFFGGSGSTTVANGGSGFSDWLNASAFSLAKFAKGSTFYVRGRLRFSTPSTDQLVHMGGGKGTGNYTTKCDPTKVNFTNGVLSTGQLTYSMINGGVNGTDANGTFGTYFPLPLGHHNSPCPVFIGDSKSYGTGDTPIAATAIGGMGRLAFSPDATTPANVICPSINMGIPSGTPLEWTVGVSGANIAVPRSWFAYCTHAVVGYGTNAFQTGNLQTIYGYLRAAGISKIIQRSLTPNPTDLKLTFTAMSATGTACQGTVASTALLTEGNTYTIAGCTPSAYNGNYSIHIVDGSTVSYTSASAPGGSATVNGTMADNARTISGQLVTTGWSVGGAADTYEQTLKGWTSTDANLTYYQSQGERAATSGADYWHWAVNGTPWYMTADDKHESALGYEQNIGTAGTVTTQAGGTVASSLRSYMATWLLS